MLLHPLDALVGPRFGVGLVFNGGVFGRQAEGVPADRLEDVETVGALEAGDHIADGVIPDVAHVEVAGGIGEHDEVIKLHFFLGVGFFVSKNILPSLASALILSPGLNLPSMISLERGFSRYFWTARRRGRAPNFGS